MFRRSSGTYGVAVPAAVANVARPQAAAPSLRGCGRAQERKVAAVVRAENFLRIQLSVTSFGLRRYRLRGGPALF